MNVDIIRVDGGYFGIYVGGQLEYWGAEDPFPTLCEIVEGVQLGRIEYHSLGNYGYTILSSGAEEPPDRFEDIPNIWWSDAHYQSPSWED